MAAVYCWNGFEARGWFGRVRLIHMRAEVVTADGQRQSLDPADIVRIGKVMDDGGVIDRLPVGIRGA